MRRRGISCSAGDDEGNDEMAEKADCEAGEEEYEQGFFHVSGSFHLFRSIKPVILKIQHQRARIVTP
ncbi:hypothetical protein AGR5A_Cc190061 [Agrobacterium genomosp. 5 str. CFBP 6626]|nr:hypothetical protein AGR5A_Cc190061 [Agrobacterium genomosp. 5 str. CFBP 6626]